MKGCLYAVAQFEKHFCVECLFYRQYEYRRKKIFSFGCKNLFSFFQTTESSFEFLFFQSCVDSFKTKVYYFGMVRFAAFSIHPTKRETTFHKIGSTLQEILAI